MAVAVFSQWANRFDETRFYVWASALIATGLVIGGLLLRRFAYADAPIHDQADREIVLPLAALLIEGAENRRWSLCSSAALAHDLVQGEGWATKRGAAVLSLESLCRYRKTS
ncbi:MAG: hypothetical protein ABW221_23430 [Vicinamibacteria bacterium]